MDKVLEFFTDDVIAQKATIPQFRGIKALKEDYIRMFVSFKDSTRSTTELVDHIEISSSADMAWNTGQYTTHYKETGEPRMWKGKYICAWRKVDDKWKIAAFSITRSLPYT